MGVKARSTPDNDRERCSDASRPRWSRFWRWIVWNVRYQRKRIDLVDYMASAMREDMRRRYRSPEIICVSEDDSILAPLVIWEDDDGNLHTLRRNDV